MIKIIIIMSQICCSVAKLCLTLCNPLDCSTPGFPVLHCLSACSDSCALSRSYHPTISSCVAPFSSCLQSFPALGSFPVSWFFASGGQSIEASASVLPMNIQGPKSLINNITYTFFSWLIKRMILGPFYRWETESKEVKLLAQEKAETGLELRFPLPFYLPPCTSQNTSKEEFLSF